MVSVCTVRSWVILAFALTGGCVVGSSDANGWTCVPGLVADCICADGTPGIRTCGTGTAYGTCHQSCPCPDGSQGIAACEAVTTSCACAGAAAVCAPGHTQACTCTGGYAGSQECLAGGAGYSACSCGMSTCTANLGQPCTTDADCCPSAGASTFCANLGNLGNTCTVRCTTDAMCSTGCCAMLGDGTSACAPAVACGATTSCTRSPGQTCSADADCCADTATVRATVCTAYVSHPAVCWPVCTSNTDCSTGCCLPHASGVRACAPASLCGPSPTCIAATGAPCAVDTDCCPDPATGTATVCTNVGDGPVCSPACTVGTDCATGCCAMRSDGVRSCAPATACG